MKIQELGHVVLYVSDINRSANFYAETLGFSEIKSEGARRGMAIFSSGRTHHELLLIEVGGVPDEKKYPKPGLYHIGFKIGDGPEAAREAYKYLVEQGVQIVGTSDHGVTHSIYILDPDGNELELYADVSDGWKMNPGAIMAPAKRLVL